MFFNKNRIGYINMKKFNKDKYLKKLRFKKYKRYLYIGIPCLLVLLIGIYFAYSKFSVSKDTEVVRTTVGDFISGDVVIGAYIDGEYSKTIPGKNDGYVVDKIVCDNDASASWDNDSWGIVLTNLTKRTKCNVYFETKKPPLTEVITTAMNSNPSMFATDDPDNNVRYIGKDPSNYVYFNCSDYNNQTASTCELWRIIGVFDNVTKGDGSKENLVKIIKNDFLDSYYWDAKIAIQTDSVVRVGTSQSAYASNDWTDSQLMMLLNPADYLKSGYKNSNDIIYDSNDQEIYGKMGSYYNGTGGCVPTQVNYGEKFECYDRRSYGLRNDTTRNAIEEIIWNLGSTSSDILKKGVLVSDWYGYERGTVVYSGHATTWTGKIGLMYPSDYGYATSGGTTKNRSECLAKDLSSWNSSDFNDCRKNDYLYKSSYNQWTLTPAPSNNAAIVAINDTGRLDTSANAVYGRHVYPALFLKSNIVVKSGTGESSNHYQLKLE